MRPLLEDLKVNLELNKNPSETILQALNFYCSLKDDENYEKRIKDELLLILSEKRTSKAYFNIPFQNSRLKPSGYNQIIMVLLKRIWEEEDFTRMAKLPKEIRFLNLDETGYAGARISEDDVWRYTSNLNVLPFISSSTGFFQKRREEQIKQVQNWLKFGNKLSDFLSRIRLSGAFAKTIHSAGKNLAYFAEEYDRNPSFLDKALPDHSNSAPESFIDLLSEAVLSNHQVEEGYFKINELTLKRQFQNAEIKAEDSRHTLKVLFEILKESKVSSLKMEDEEIIKLGARILSDFQKTVSSAGNTAIRPAVPSGYESYTKAFAALAEESNTRLDYAFLTDKLLYELREIIRKNPNPSELHLYIRSLTDSCRKTIPDITEKHITLSYLILREILKNVPEKSMLEHTVQMAEKLKVSREEAVLLFHFLLSDRASGLQLSLKNFTEKCIAENQNSILSEKQIGILRGITGNLNDSVKAFQFQILKEKIKSKIEDEERKKIIDTVTELVHIRIAEIRAEWTVKAVKKG